MSAAELDSTEQLLWTILTRFETQALEQYRRHWPAWASPEKAALVDEMARGAAADEALERSELGRPMAELLERAATAERPDAVLIIQGMVLERVRAVVHQVLSRSPGASAWTRSLAARGAALSADISSQAADRLGNAVGRGEPTFLRFAEDSDEVLHKLDAVGEGVDRIFGERFALKFADVVGEFVADLVPACTSLGMDRRRVMSHLAGALMGI